MKKAPNIVSFAQVNEAESSRAFISGRWVPVRPLGYFSLGNRFKCAWLVFTGKADALVWPMDQ